MSLPSLEKLFLISVKLW